MDALKYHLAENLLTPDPSDYMAQVEVSKSFTLDDVVAEMLKRGTSLTKTDTVAVLNLFHQIVAELVEQGYAINLPLCNGTPSVSGVFNSPADSFDVNRHFVKYNLNAGVLIREAIKKIKTEKTDPVDKLPYLEQYFDAVSQTASDILTAGGIGELQGSMIAFDASDEEQGIYFVASDGTETKVAVVAMNKPSKLMFMVPELAAGEYEILLKVKFRNTKALKTTGLKKVLTVTGQAG